MSTVTYFSDKVTYPAGLGSGVHKVQNTIDFSEYNCASSDVVQCLKIPAGALVLQAGVRVDTPEGGTATGDLGVTGNDPNGFLDATNLNATAGTFDIGDTTDDAYIEAGGKAFATADTIDLVLDSACDTAVVTVFAVYTIIE